MRKHRDSARCTLVKGAVMAEQVSVCERTIENWRSEGRIPYLKIGRCVRYEPDQVLEALRAFEIQARMRPGTRERRSRPPAQVSPASARFNPAAEPKKPVPPENRAGDPCRQQPRDLTAQSLCSGQQLMPAMRRKSGKPSS